MPTHKWSEQNGVVTRFISHTKEHLLSNKASKLSCSVDRVPFPQDKLQFANLRAFPTMLEDCFGVKIMGNEIGGFEEKVNVGRACAPQRK